MLSSKPLIWWSQRLRRIQKSCRQKDNFTGDKNQKLVVPRTVVVEVASPSVHLVMFYMFWALWRNSCMWGITEPSTSPINCSGSCGSAQFTWMMEQIVGTQSSTCWKCTWDRAPQDKVMIGAQKQESKKWKWSSLSWFTSPLELSKSWLLSN